MAEDYKICVRCGGKAHIKKITTTFDTPHGKVTLDNVESYVCDDCGEPVFTPDQLKQVENAIKQAQS